MWNLIIPAVSTILDKIFPDADKANEAKARLMELQIKGELDSVLGQLEINKEEAKSSSIFVAGWRPSVGWTCSISLFYEFLIRPIATGFGKPMPPIDVEALNTLLFALLGVAGLRTVEKVKGAA